MLLPFVDYPKTRRAVWLLSFLSSVVVVGQWQVFAMSIKVKERMAGVAVSQGASSLLVRDKGSDQRSARSVQRCRGRCRRCACTDTPMHLKQRREGKEVENLKWSKMHIGKLGKKRKRKAPICSTGKERCAKSATNNTQRFTSRAFLSRKPGSLDSLSDSTSAGLEANDSGAS